MSVALFRFNDNKINADSKVTLSENISTESFYEKYWEKAIHEQGIKIFQDGSKFSKSELREVLKELGLLREWANSNLKGSEKEYMVERIEHMQEIIPKAFINDNTILFIF